ncbi:GNAT family N-acetyltransferase [Nocardia sp. NPDC051030]|uniref:GNAT family N-acetyltransferase n=1 Tax=Nocardia sp. NPDC051030 TaxID=3155162 RepID=UPI00341A50B0
MRWVISDGFIRLRPVVLADAPVYLAAEDDDLVRWYTGGRSTPEGVANYFHRCVRDWESDAPVRAFAVEDLSTGTTTGLIDAKCQLSCLAPGQANLSYGIYPPWRGRGIATHAVNLACTLLADSHFATQAVLRIAPENLASQAVAHRTHFTFSHRTDDTHGPLNWYLRDLTESTLQ